MQSQPESDDSRPYESQLAEIATAVQKLAGHVRTIQILLIVYMVSTIFISLSSLIYTFSGAMLEHVQGQIQDRIGDARHNEDDESNLPGPADPLPAISLPDADGKVWTNSDWEGKALLLNFWATWCPPCIEEMPIFDEALEKYGEKGFAVVAISVDRKGWEVVRPFVAEHGLSYPVLLADESITRTFGKVNQLPMTYLVHTSGTIHSRQIGSMSRSRIMNKVEDLLREDGLLETPRGTS